MFILAFVVLGACASSSEIRSNAAAHAQKARWLESRGYYVEAAKERAAADKQYRKANQRAYEEASRDYYWW